MQHLTFALTKSGTYPAWASPTAGQPVTTATFTGSRDNNRFEDTGATIRSRFYRSQGAVNNGTGSVSFRGYPVGLLPHLFRAFLTSVSRSTLSGGYDNDLLPNDATDVQLPWFSFQQNWNGQFGQNSRGAVLTSLTLSCTGGEELRADASFVIAETAKAGGQWSDGTSSAALVTATYPSPLPPPLRFHEGVVTLGGSFSKSGNRLNYSSAGTVIGKIQSASIAITLNHEGRFAIRQGAPTIAFTRHGIRDIQVTADIDWADFAAGYYDNMKNGAESAFQLKFISNSTFSGNAYEMFLSLPRVVYPADGAPAPQTDGNPMPKTQALKFDAMEDADTDTDIGVSFQTTDSLL